MYLCRSTAHPGVFSTITSGGTLHLYNLCQSATHPVTSLLITDPSLEDTNTVTASSSSSSSSGSSGGSSISKSQSLSALHANSTIALTKTMWLSDGRKLLIGNSRGTCHSTAIAKNILDLRSSDESKLDALVAANTK